MRYPAVAGSFYPLNANTLTREVDAFLAQGRKEVSVSANIAIAPHAGYEYSGKTAGYSFAALEKNLKKENTSMVILCPNHTGLGEIVSVSFEDWKTPIGTSSTDLRLAAKIILSCPLMRRNEAAHFREHSIEVMLPFIQRINPKAKIVAICIGVQGEKIASEVGKAIFDACSDNEFKDRNILLLASSDFTHYESGERAKLMDKMPIEFIKKLDANALEREVEQNGLSICGHGPIAAAIYYAKLAGKKEAKLLKYTNSGKETNGNESSVVAYASLVFI
ncbi:MAG: AmmeMemoRadiSam system protein B [Candidatus Micrarchaeia archaeon]